VLPLERLLSVGLRWLSFVGDDAGNRRAEGPPENLGAQPTGDERVTAGVAAELSSTLRTWSVGRPAPDAVTLPGVDLPTSPYAAEDLPERGRPAGRVPHAQADLTLLDELTSGGVLLGAGRLDEARAAYGAALVTGRDAGHSLSALQAMVGLASVAAGQEDLVHMTGWSEQVLADAQGTPWAMSPRLLPAHVLAAWGAFHVFDAETARERNRTALELVAAVTAIPPVAGAPDLDSVDGPDATSTAARGLEQLARLARMLQAHLDLDAAAAEPGARQDVATRVMADARVVSRLSMTPAMAVAELSRAHLVVLLAGFPRLALEIEQLCAALPGSELESAVMASVRHLRAGEDVAARTAAAPLLSLDPASLPLRPAVTAHLVKAVVAHRNAQPTVAHEGLVAALTRAAPQRALRMVLELAPEVADVLAVGIGRFGALESFALELREHALEAAEPRTEPLLDVALSARELSLLRELPSLLTVAEIADARAVSRNTVKTQLRSLFQKLGVGSRRDAVAAARRLGLL
jgi:DNA-binding CsgD family transcriptional regulator